MTLLTKVLDTLTGICVALLFTKYFVNYANDMFDWHLRWYFLENVPHLESSPDSCVKCYTMFLPFLLIKIDVFS